MLSAPPPAPRRTYWQRFVAAACSRVALVLAAVAVSVMVGLGVLATWLWSASISESCAEPEVAELDIDELIALRRRLERYQSDPSPVAELRFSGRELGAILRDGLSFQVAVGFVGDRTRLHVVAPRDDGTCVDVRFGGRVEVADGVAVLTVEDLQVGTIDWSGWLGGRRVVVTPSRLPDDRAAALLENTAGLRVEYGHAVVQLVDRWEVW